MPVDADETETLYAALELLARDAAARVDVGGRTSSSSAEHDLTRAADLYVAALEQGAR